MSDSSLSCGLQQARLPCPSLSPRVCWDSCSLSQWCYLTILSSVTPFSFCLQSFPRFFSVDLPIWNISFKRSYTCGILWLAPFILWNVFKFHPCCSVYQYFIPCKCQIMVHCVNIRFFFISSSLDGHWNCFYFLAVMNETAMSTLIQVLVDVCF